MSFTSTKNDSNLSNDISSSSLQEVLTRYEDLFNKLNVKALSIENGVLNLEMSDLSDLYIIEQVEFFTGLTVRPIAATTSVNAGTFIIDSVNEIPSSDNVLNTDNSLVAPEASISAQPIAEIKNSNEPLTLQNIAPVEEQYSTPAPTPPSVEKQNRISISKDPVRAKIQKAVYAVDWATDLRSSLKEAAKALCLSGYEQGIIYLGSSETFEPIAHWQLAGKQSMFYRQQELDRFKSDLVADLCWQIDPGVWTDISSKSDDCFKLIKAYLADPKTIHCYYQQKANKSILIASSVRPNLTNSKSIDAILKLLYEKI